MKICLTTIGWDPVTEDMAGNPIAVSRYHVTAQEHGKDHGASVSFFTTDIMATIPVPYPGVYDFAVSAIDDAGCHCEGPPGVLGMWWVDDVHLTWRRDGDTLEVKWEGAAGAAYRIERMRANDPNSWDLVEGGILADKASEFCSYIVKRVSGDGNYRVVSEAAVEVPTEHTEYTDAKPLSGAA